MKDIIVIVGPTGIGKTKLSIALAKELDAEIINGDSVSIYKELNIGSAKPTAEEMANIPHHLFSIRGVNDDYTVYDYQNDVRRVIKDIQNRGKRVIIVGGTGLYIKAALYDYQFAKEEKKNDYSHLSNEEIIEKIKNYSVDIADIHNRRRMERLLQKLENKETITQGKDNCLYPIKVIGLSTNRNILYDKIDKRVDSMIKNGLIDEVKSLKKDYLTSRILNSGIGYQEFYDYLYQDKSLEEVINEIKLHSRHFAKRQFTFFRHQFPTIWLDVNFENFSKTIQDALEICSVN